MIQWWHIQGSNNDLLIQHPFSRKPATKPATVKKSTCVWSHRFTHPWFTQPWQILLHYFHTLLLDLLTRDRFCCTTFMLSLHSVLLDLFTLDRFCCTTFILSFHSLLLDLLTRDRFCCTTFILSFILSFWIYSPVTDSAALLSYFLSILSLDLLTRDRFCCTTFILSFHSLFFFIWSRCSFSICFFRAFSWLLVVPVKEQDIPINTYKAPSVTKNPRHLEDEVLSNN